MSDSDDTDSEGSQRRLHQPSLSRKMRQSIKRVKRSIRKMTEELEDEEPQPLHVVPECLTSLENRTGFSREQICKMYRAFKQHCPRGAVTTNDLKPAYAKLFPLGDSTKYAQIVFNMFDKDRDGVISFGDLLGGMASIIKGNADQKLTWIFGLYDLNGDGHITKHEMLVIVSAIYEMVQNTQTIHHAVHSHVDRLFEKMDLDKDGVISEKEFMTCCKNDQTVCDQLTIFDDF